MLRRAEERAELTGKLERSNAELEAFSYSVSHDLRAPFRHIAGYAALLTEKETNLDATSKHYLKQIGETTISAGQLVDSLLNFSQLGHIKLQRVPIDMHKLVREAQSLCAGDAQHKVEWAIGDLPPAYGDVSLLRQVWFNLIDNALKYSARRTPPRISISGRAIAAGAEYKITDNGVGFDMAYAGKLFGVFQRLHRAEDYPGTGIGLALVKRIIDRHGGSVAADGRLDEGATFVFTLPKEKKEV